MNLTSPSDVRALLAALGIAPNRTLGQNFLIDRNILNILLEAAGLAGGDTVLEVGPGLGVVTEALADSVGQLVFVEKDHRLAAYLAETVGARSHVIPVEGDILDFVVRPVAGGPLRDGTTLFMPEGGYKLVSNLPYSVASRVLVELAGMTPAPLRCVVTVQEEVARRIAAAPGDRHRGMLTVWLELNYASYFVRRVSRNCFWPRPEVSSAIVRMDRRSAPLLPEEHEAAFRRLTKLCFGQRRKQLGTILRHNPSLGDMPPEHVLAVLEAVGVNPAARPETLSIEAWCGLTRGLAARQAGQV